MDFARIFRTFLIAGWLMLVYVLLNASFPFTARIDLWGRDFATRLRNHYMGPPAEIDQLVLVTLDDETLRVSGQRFPFPRWLHAQAIDGFMSVNPRAVAYDFVFFGEGYKADEGRFSAPGLPEEDQALQDSLRRSRGVVLASYMTVDSDEQGPREEFLPPGVVSGPVNKYVQADKIVWRTSLPDYTDKKTGQIVWSWEFATLFQAGILKPEDVSYHSTNISARPRVKSGFQVPVTRRKEFYINFLAQPSDFKQVSFWRFLSRDLGGEDYSGKILLVGYTSTLSHDRHPTPLGTMDGLYLNANALLTLLSGRFIYQVPLIWQALALGLSLLIVLWTGLTNRIVTLTLAACVSAAVFIAASVWAVWHDILLDLYYEAVFLVLIWLIMAVYRQVTMAVENISLREEAIHDPLTGFFTRRYLSVRLKYDLERLGSPSLAAKRKGTPGEFALAMVDLDNFKLVNDTFGHAEGDRTLRVVAEAIRKHVRREDIVCRYGGDEFCIIMAGTNAEGGAALLERVREGIVNDDRLCYTTKGNVKSIRVTASFGVTSAKWSPDLTDLVLIKIADRALYEAKKAGRNRIVIADQMVYLDEIKKEEEKTVPPPDAEPGRGALK